MQIERANGHITRVGGLIVYDVNLPDWDLAYIKYPQEKLVHYKMSHYRHALTEAKAQIIYVTSERIYFS